MKLLLCAISITLLFTALPANVISLTQYSTTPPAIQNADRPDRSLEVYARPQQLVDIGGRRLNLYCLGQGSPTVILVGGLGASTFTWRKIHAELAKTTRVCAYDRAGYGFSDPGPLPRDTQHLAQDLAALTEAAPLSPPYILVGASLGGMIVRLYADTHLLDVGGMVLIDPEIEHEAKRLTPVSPGFLPRMKKQTEALRECLVMVQASTLAPGSTAAKDCVIDPTPEFPASVNAHIASMSSRPSYWRESLSEDVEARGAGSDQVAASRRSYGNLPLVVLTATESDTADPKRRDPEFEARANIVSKMHDEVAHLSLRGVNRSIASTHHMQLDTPQVVIDAVNEVVAAARQQQEGATRQQ